MATPCLTCSSQDIRRLDYAGRTGTSISPMQADYSTRLYLSMQRYHHIWYLSKYGNSAFGIFPNTEFPHSVTFQIEGLQECLSLVGVFSKDTVRF